MFMTCLNILSKWFADAALRGVDTWTTAIAEEFADWALHGKIYSWDIRINKIMYETLLKNLLENLEQQANAMSHMQKMKEIVTENPDMKSESLSQLLEASNFNDIYHIFTDIKIKLNDKNDRITS